MGGGEQVDNRIDNSNPKIDILGTLFEKYLSLLLVLFHT